MGTCGRGEQGSRRLVLGEDVLCLHTAAGATTDGVKASMLGAPHLGEPGSPMDIHGGAWMRLGEEEAALCSRSGCAQRPICEI